MYILAWVAFIGLMIKAGAILISYGVSCVNPEAASNLYKGMDLYPLRQYSFWHYTRTISFMVAISGMKAFVLFLVIKTLSKVNLMNPFTIEVARNIERISYVLLTIWIIAILDNAQNGWMLKRTGIILEGWDSGEFIFIAGLVFIISQVFKRGVELQSENDLTV
jgi:Protein of unknown function (DUF2975)